MEILEQQSVKDKIISLRGQDVILDFAVAEIYGVETREINQAVRNNPNKFPQGYLIEIGNKEYADLRSNFLIANNPKSRTIPKVFTEKGLYMLATIAIIEAFAKLRELSRTIGELSANPDKYAQKSLMQKSGDIMADLFGEELHTSGTEIEIELNFAVLKLRHSVKRERGEK